MSEQNPPKRTRMRRILIACAVLILLLGTLAFFAPYLLKRYVEKHSEEWIGRKLTIGSIILNPFTFTFGLADVTCYEPKSEQRFVAWKKAQTKWDLWAWWSQGNWRFHRIELREPYVHVTQNGDRFNFSDLLEFGGDEKEAPDPADTIPTKFTLEELVISDGQVDYASDLLKVPVSAQRLNVRCTQMTSASSRMDFDLDFSLSSGGSMDGSFMIDTEKELYGINAGVKALDLSAFLPYVTDVMDCKAIRGSLDVDLDLIDSWSDTTALALSTVIGLSGFELQDNAGSKLLALAKGGCDLDTLTTKGALFKLSTLDMDGAYMRFEMYSDSTDNWTRLMKFTEEATGDSGATEFASSESNVFVMLADYIRLLGKEFIANEYNAERLSFTNGTIDFADHSMPLPFRYTISQLALHSSRVTTDQPTASMDVTALLNNSGVVVGELIIDPKEFKDLTANLSVDQFVLRDLDPYMRWYAAHPELDGVLAYQGSTVVKAGKIDAQNHVRIDRMKLGKKNKEHAEGIYVMPLRLAVGLLKDPKGIIDLDIPVTGDLNNPDFKPWPIVWQVLKNLLLKAVSAPANLIANAIGGEGKNLEAVRFDVMQAAIGKPQARAAEDLSKALAAKPELAVDLIPLVDSTAECGEIALFASRARMLFGEAAVLSAADSARVIGLSTADSSFTRYLDQAAPTTMGQNVRARCMAFISKAAMEQQQHMERTRRENFMKALLDAGVPPARVRFRSGTEEELATWLGAPGYRFIFDAAP